MPNIKRIMPKSLDIRKHWVDRLWELKRFDSPEEFMEPLPCFACGMYFNEAPPERAHIKSRWNGGTDKVENLHLLCAVCHKDSEFLEGVQYWDWFIERTEIDMFLSNAARRGMNLSRLFFT